jgi:PilZ domain-containing protein
MTSSAGAPRTNRRLTARKACLLTVRYKKAKDWHPATCMDLSRDGCRLRLGEDLERGSSLVLLFEAPLADGARSPSVEVNGTVTWGRIEGLSYQAGVHFAADSNAIGDIVNAIF